MLFRRKNKSDFAPLHTLLSQNKENPYATNDDQIFRRNTKLQIDARDDKYTKLLAHFVRITKFRNYIKEFLKWTFLILIFIFMCILSYMVYQLFSKYIKEATIQEIITGIPLLTTAIIGFVSTIIAIPIAITKYLFNTKEDDNITNIIAHTQQHDMEVRNLTYKQDSELRGTSIADNENCNGADEEQAV